MVVANVLVIRKVVSNNDTYHPERWCVDSGANRHLCKSVAQAKGREKKKDLTIGEAGMGHFKSEVEGPISSLMANQAIS